MSWIEAITGACHTSTLSIVFAVVVASSSTVAVCFAGVMIALTLSGETDEDMVIMSRRETFPSSFLFPSVTGSILSEKSLIVARALVASSSS